MSGRLFSCSDILVVFGLDRRIASRLNMRWDNICKTFEEKKNVPPDERDYIYYTSLTFLKNQCLDYMDFINELKEVHLITNSKWVTVTREIDAFIKHMESEYVYGTW